jgi:hypothetical protein
MKFRTYFADAVGLAAIIGITVAIYVMPAKAQDFDCSGIGDLAESVMTHRQDNVPLSVVMEATDATAEQMIAQGNNPDEVYALADLMKTLAVAAYEMTRFSTPARQRETIRDFRNDAEVECYIALR